MATTATVTTLLDGTKHRVIHVALTSDGTASQLTDSVIYDYSADTNLPEDSVAGSNKIQKVIFTNSSGAQIDIEFAGATDGLALTCPAGVTEDMEFDEIGGIKNIATTPTGDITLTTRSFGNNQTAVLVICMDKS